MLADAVSGEGTLSGLQKDILSYPHMTEISMVHKNADLGPNLEKLDGSF